ncbi:hypothetical protein Tco_0838891, partial [Tanacetum coccineum]
SGPSKKTGKAMISKKQKVLGSPSIGRICYQESSQTKAKVAKEKAKEKRTKKGIKTAKVKAKKKEAEEADKGQNVSETEGIMMRMPKKTSKKMMMKMLMSLLNLKQELLAELEAIKEAAEKEATETEATFICYKLLRCFYCISNTIINMFCKIVDNDENVDETADVNQTDNEEDVEETDDVEQVLKKIPTMPFLNTSTRSKKKEADKGVKSYM